MTSSFLLHISIARDKPSHLTIYDIYAIVNFNRVIFGYPKIIKIRLFTISFEPSRIHMYKHKSILVILQLRFVTVFCFSLI